MTSRERFLKVLNGEMPESNRQKRLVVARIKS